MKILNYIAEAQAANGVSPKHNEIASAFGISPSSVRQYLRVLTRKGYVTMTRYAHRGIRLVRGRGKWKVQRSWVGEFDRRIGSRLEGETDLGRIFGMVAGDLRTWLDVERADLHVLDPHRHELRGRSFYEMRPGTDTGQEAEEAGPGSVVGHAFRRRRPIVDPPASGRPGVAAIPVQGRDRVLGILRLEDRRPGRLGPETLTRGGVAAAALAPALDRSTLNTDLQRRIRLQTALVSLCQTINSVRDLETTLREMYAVVAGMVEAPMFLIVVRDEAGAEWVLHERDEADGQVYEQIGPRPFRRQSGSLMELLNTQPYVIRHRTPEEIREFERKGPGVAADSLLSAGLVQKRSRSLLFVPLRASGRRIGELTVQCYRYNAYRVQDAEDLILVGEYIGMALQNALRDETVRGRTIEDRRRLRRLGEELRELAAGPAGADLCPRLAALAAEVESLHRIAPADPVRLLHKPGIDDGP